MNKSKPLLIFGVKGVDYAMEIAKNYEVVSSHLDVVFKYLGFHVKPINYNIKDWCWLIDKFENILTTCTHSWLTLGGRLVLVQLVLQSIVVFWMHLYLMPKNIIKRINSCISNFIWARTREVHKVHLVWHEEISKCHNEGGWGILDIQSLDGNYW